MAIKRGLDMGAKHVELILCLSIWVGCPRVSRQADFCQGNLGSSPG